MEDILPQAGSVISQLAWYSFALQLEQVILWFDFVLL